MYIIILNILSTDICIIICMLIYNLLLILLSCRAVSCQFFNLIKLRICKITYTVHGNMALKKYMQCTHPRASGLKASHLRERKLSISEDFSPPIRDFTEINKHTFALISWCQKTDTATICIRFKFARWTCPCRRRIAVFTCGFLQIAFARREFSENIRVCACDEHPVRRDSTSYIHIRALTAGDGGCWKIFVLFAIIFCWSS